MNYEFHGEVALYNSDADGAERFEATQHAKGAQAIASGNGRSPVRRIRTGRRPRGKVTRRQSDHHRPLAMLTPLIKAKISRQTLAHVPHELPVGLHASATSSLEEYDRKRDLAAIETTT